MEYDLPQLSTEKTWANKEGSAISASVNDEEYSGYVGSVVDYFLLNDSARHFGEKVQRSLVAEMLPDYILVPLTMGQSYTDSIVLVFSFTDELAESGDGRKLLQNAIQISFKREESSSWGVSFNLTVYLNKDIGTRIPMDYE